MVVKRFTGLAGSAVLAASLAASLCAPLSSGLAQDNPLAQPIDMPSDDAGVWQVAPLGAALIAALSALPSDATQQETESVILKVLFDRGLVEGRLPLWVVLDALDMVLAGDWSVDVRAGLESVNARAASEVALERIEGVSGDGVAAGQLGMPPTTGSVLVGSDYQE